jgi:hypothetical protein
MSKHTKHKTPWRWLKAYYQAAEREAAQAAPFYVSQDGGLFALPEEVIRATIVKSQLQAFASLREEAKEGQDAKSVVAS